MLAAAKMEKLHAAPRAHLQMRAIVLVACCLLLCAFARVSTYVHVYVHECIIKGFPPPEDKPYAPPLF